MATVSFDAVLNFIIPPIIWIFLAWILYKPFKEPLSDLWAKIGEWRDNRDSSEQPWELNPIKTIEYE